MIKVLKFPFKSLTFLFGTIAIAAALQELKTLNPVHTLKFEI